MLNLIFQSKGKTNLSCLEKWLVQGLNLVSAPVSSTNFLLDEDLDCLMTFFPSHLLVHLFSHEFFFFALRPQTYFGSMQWEIVQLLTSVCPAGKLLLFRCCIRKRFSSVLEARFLPFRSSSADLLRWVHVSTFTAFPEGFLICRIWLVKVFVQETQIKWPAWFRIISFFFPAWFDKRCPINYYSTVWCFIGK